MVGATALTFLTLLPTLITCSGEGNIHILEKEVAVALKSCSYPSNNKEKGNHQRQRRSNDGIENLHLDHRKPEINKYDHVKRNTSDMREQKPIVNIADPYEGYGTVNGGGKLVTSAPRVAVNRNFNTNVNRSKRSEPLLNKGDSDQCLSQCVFANLQVVDSHGIPREDELWNLIQSSVTSQQSRATMRDQIRACFQELESEAEDNGCSYSNKLERCLMLRFFDRKLDKQTNNQNS